MIPPEQVAQAAHDSTPWVQVAVGLGLGAGQFLTWISGKRRGNHGKRENKDALDAIAQKIAGVETQVATLSAHVIGPDGENGIRGDVRELKKQVGDILDRERQGLWNPPQPPYDRRRQ